MAIAIKYSTAPIALLLLFILYLLIRKREFKSVLLMFCLGLLIILPGVIRNYIFPCGNQTGRLTKANYCIYNTISPFMPASGLIVRVRKVYYPFLLSIGSPSGGAGNPGQTLFFTFFSSPYL
jgi:hypothetical protein